MEGGLWLWVNQINANFEVQNTKRHCLGAGRISSCRFFYDVLLRIGRISVFIKVFYFIFVG
jgi:hypothetical protein